MKLKYRNDNFLFAYRFFDRWGRRINTGILLMSMAVLAMIIANSPLGDWYQNLWATEIHLGTEKFNFFSRGGTPMTLLELVNDALMAVFFLSVGLEMKREMLVGELSSMRQILLPCLAAIGGMLVPALIFYLTGQALSFSPEQMRGTAIPMATDIAFSLAVLSLFGKRVPLSLKVFLLAFATIDDLGGIIVIALFYSSLSSASLLFLAIAALALVILLIGSRLRVNTKMFYAVFGIIIWYCFLQAGINPTIAGVVVAFTIPARPYTNLKNYVSGMKNALKLIDRVGDEEHKEKDEEILLTNTEITILNVMEKASDRVISPLQDIEDSIRTPVNYFIMPLFALANAGVIFDFSGSVASMFAGVSLAVMAGLVIGKTLGLFLFTWLSVKLKISPMLSGTNWKSIFGVAMLGGIGFTVALFLANLSYPGGSLYLNQARFGIIFGSLISGLAGSLFLNMVLPKRGRKRQKAKDN